MEYLDTVSELNYLTQIVIMLYEDPSEEENSHRRFHVELHFSPGAYGCFDVLPDVRNELTKRNKNEKKIEFSFSHSQIDPVNLNVNLLRTVLPKSNREAAHSPPRHRQKTETVNSSSLDFSTLNDENRSKQDPNNENNQNQLNLSSSSQDKINARILKQRSLTSKMIHRTSTPVMINKSSEHVENLANTARESKQTSRKR